MQKTGGHPLIDLTGRRYGRLVVLSRVPGYPDRPRWLFRCDCGREKDAAGHELRRGRVQSCGCLRAEVQPLANRQHGHAGSGNGTPEYQTWLGMRKRCSDPGHTSYRYYGARGITVCAAWQESFEVFLADMGPRPSPEHSIDRYPDRAGNYEPGNCRWATALEQRHNTSNSPRLTEDAVRTIRGRCASGRRGVVAALAREYGVTHSTIQKIRAGTLWGHVR